jgi:hypothetical protein
MKKSRDAAPRAADKIRRPCESCPWRVDASREHWDPQHFVDIWGSCQGDNMAIMLCHKSIALPKEDRSSVPCQGWIRVMGFNAIGVRLLAMQDRITIEEVEDKDGPALFPTFAAMMRANKIKLHKRSRMKP